MSRALALLLLCASVWARRPRPPPAVSPALLQYAMVGGCNASTLLVTGSALLAARFSRATGTTSPDGLPPTSARAMDSLFISMANAVSCPVPPVVPGG